MKLQGPKKYCAGMLVSCVMAMLITGCVEARKPPTIGDTVDSYLEIIRKLMSPEERRMLAKLGKVPRRGVIAEDSIGCWRQADLNSLLTISRTDTQLVAALLNSGDCVAVGGSQYFIRDLSTDLKTYDLTGRYSHGIARIRVLDRRGSLKLLLPIDWLLPLPESKPTDKQP